MTTNKSLQLGKAAIIRDDDNFVVNIPLTNDGAVSLLFEAPTYSKNELETILTCNVSLPGQTEGSFAGRINAKSLSSRESFARGLRDSFGKEIPWSLILSRATKLLIDAHKEHMLSLRVELDDIQDKSTSYLLGPLLQENAPNALFAKGGMFKTFLSMRMAMSLASGTPFLDIVPSTPDIKTLFLDYENTAGVFKDRIEKLSKYCPGFEAHHRKNLLYIHSRGVPLHELKDNLSAIIKRDKIEFLIVDSVALACGGAPEDAQNAIRYFNTLNSFGITTLSIAHETKAENSNKFMFGSVFFSNSARNIWNIGADQEQDEDVLHIALFHRKCNDGRITRPIGVRIYFGDGVDINKESPFRFESELGLKTRILSALYEENMTLTELKEEIPDKDKAQIKSRLSELHRTGLVEKPENKGGKWSSLSTNKEKSKEPNLGLVDTKNTEDYPW